MMENAPFRPFKVLLFIISCLLAACSSPKISSAVETSPAKDVTRSAASLASPTKFLAELSSSNVVDGSVIMVTAHVPKRMLASESKITGRFEKTHFWFYPAPEVGEGVYRAVVGIPHGHKPGPSDIEVSVSGVVQKLPIEIADAKYPTERLQVKSHLVNPSKKDIKLILRDIASVKKIYTTITRKKYWHGPFVMPVNSVVTDAYGINRIFNGKKKSFHNGLDLRAPIGTPIRAPAGGVVVLARKMFFTGNTVLIDHGYGIVTIYAHMSRLKVKKGEIVKARQVLGLSGMTGRADGPHLHWGFVINQVKVSPLDAIRVIQ